MALNWLNIAYGVVDVLFVLTGGLLMTFALMSEEVMRAGPTVKNVAEMVALNECPLIALIINAALVFATFLLSVPTAFMPSRRGWLRLQGWGVVLCAVFTLALGLVIWFQTLQTRANMSVAWNRQDAAHQSLLQQRFNCCGYINATEPQFVQDPTCPSQGAASRKQGCVGPLADFANRYLDLIFTAAFGVVAVDVVMLLCVVMLIKRREEFQRYRHIDEKIFLGGL